MAIQSKVRWCLVFVAALLGVGQANAALIYHISIDTSSASGVVDAFMYFDLTNGDPNVDHSVTISAFASDGTTLVSPPVLIPSEADLPGAITGELPNTVSMSESAGPSFALTYSQGISTLGDIITFDFQIFGDLSPIEPPTIADGFAFTLLSSGGEPLLPPLVPSDEEAPGMLFVYSIGEEDPLRVISSAVTYSVEEVSDVPEPGLPALLMAGLLALGFVRNTRKVPLRRESTP